MRNNFWLTVENLGFAATFDRLQNTELGFKVLLRQFKSWGLT